MALKRVSRGHHSISLGTMLLDARNAADSLRSMFGVEERARYFFLFFLVSGFCSLVYETIWLRLAMASFGVTTASISIVVSVFMAGLALGSWASGRLLRDQKLSASAAVRFYATAELMIGLSGLAVPAELAAAQRLLERTTGGALGSTHHYLLSGVLIALTLLPWTVCMGATIPLAMAGIRQRRSFSYLYLANVTGAILGTLLPTYLLVEMLGFRRTLQLAAVFNLLLGIAALAVSRRVDALVARSGEAKPKDQSDQKAEPFEDASSRGVIALLFLTGFATMAFEVVWIRQFTPFLGTYVYSFATILACYLGATFVGSTIYRLRGAAGVRAVAVLCAVAGLLAVLPLVPADVRLTMNGLWATAWWQAKAVIPLRLRVLIGVVPLSALFGYVTPMLVDRWSLGRPERAGTAYAVNAIGCILGPLVAGFVLLPVLGDRWATVVLAAPLVCAAALALFRGGSRRAAMIVGVTTVATCMVVLLTRGFDETFSRAEVRRDHTATVIAAGEEMDKRLYVNGVSMTNLAAGTKMMAHLPLAALTHRPRSALAICFGMGTTFRSMTTWNIAATGVELVPSVADLFPYFHPDATAVLARPNARVVIDDGRQFLERSHQQYDVIALDPPPPVEAASSSLLYSSEFYTVARRRLAPGGILQQWLPAGDAATIASVARALVDAFPHVRVFHPVEAEGWGLHFLVSDQPINLSAPALARKMPAMAVADLLEWGPYRTAEEQFAAMLGREVDIAKLIALEPDAPALADDRPVNEYYWLRRFRHGAIPVRIR